MTNKEKVGALFQQAKTLSLGIPWNLRGYNARLGFKTSLATCTPLVASESDFSHFLVADTG